ncbi:hypothetical protein HPB47_001730 [Ixodes persulcatus]|uniref:Uncharacterized protein n=1 Tax=Ixodes persulcatus TaxID=34615 RepID=A0AC60PQ14_IXOPE|nr:hypothetical protein HPB47_001730 [Ixodes persulcatus]
MAAPVCWLLVAAALGVVNAEGADFTMTVLHTNDVHGRFEEIRPDGTSCPKADAEKGLCVGGIARQKTLVDEVRKKGGNVLFLNTGDYYQGSLWYYLLGAEIVVKAVNYLKHDAMVCILLYRAENVRSIAEEFRFGRRISPW